MDPFITGPILLAIVGREVIAWIVRRSLNRATPRMEDFCERAFSRKLTDDERQGIARERDDRVLILPRRFFP